MKGANESPGHTRVRQLVPKRTEACGEHPSNWLVGYIETAILEAKQPEPRTGIQAYKKASASKPDVNQH